uniref:Uncharacterized protein n=1 Tax=Panagrellus redivivus TaxID=6233 RepID=A0A7E4ZW64_PANRE
MVACNVGSSCLFAGAFVVFAMLITPNTAEILIPQYLPSYLTGPFVRRSLPLGPALREKVEESNVPASYDVQDLLVGRIQPSNNVPNYLRSKGIESAWGPKNIRLANGGYGQAIKKFLMRMATV